MMIVVGRSTGYAQGLWPHYDIQRGVVNSISESRDYDADSLSYPFLHAFTTPISLVSQECIPILGFLLSMVTKYMFVYLSILS